MRALFFSLLLRFITAVDVDYLKALDDLITYRISFKSHAEEETYHRENENTSKWVTITSADEEKYQCLLPTLRVDAKKRIEAYSGPSPLELIKPLYDENFCAYRAEAYWMYEFCHGRFILQYHDEKETKTRTEFYLGNYAQVQAEAENAKFDQLSPPMRKFDEDELAYYPVTYVQGTNCDLTGRPRQTIVLYVCDEGSKSTIQSIIEVSSCVYELVLRTNRLCAHPSFQRAPSNEHDVNCFAVNPQQANPKPRALLSKERESTSDFLKEFTTFGGNGESATSAPSSKNIFTRLLESGDTSDGLEQLNMILEALKASTIGKKSEALLPPKTPTPQAQQLIEQFWSGKTCLTGGTGWWKYEICHGRTVVQYHVEAGKEERTNIVLGVFHREVHKNWVKENPHKARLENDGKVFQITNLYTQGDLCPETGAHRSCEVRLRCHAESASSKILIYLLEPDICSYVLVIESSLLCDGLKRADEYGILPNMPELSAFDAVDKAKEVSSKTHGAMEMFRREDVATLSRPNPHIPGNDEKLEDSADIKIEFDDETTKKPTSDQESNAEEAANSNNKLKATRIKLGKFLLDELFDENAIVEMVQDFDLDGVTIRKEIQTLDLDDDDDKKKANDRETEEKEAIEQKAEATDRNIVHDEN